MDDDTFVSRLKEKIEEAAGTEITFQLDIKNRTEVSVDFSETVPRVAFGADVLTYPGLARMFTQYAILCLKERRQVEQRDFLLFLRRN
jgi:hypothetical protein